MPLIWVPCSINGRLSSILLNLVGGSNRCNSRRTIRETTTKLWKTKSYIRECAANIWFNHHTYLFTLDICKYLTFLKALHPGFQTCRGNCWRGYPLIPDNNRDEQKKRTKWRMDKLFLKNIRKLPLCLGRNAYNFELRP